MDVPRTKGLPHTCHAGAMQVPRARAMHATQVSRMCHARDCHARTIQVRELGLQRDSARQEAAALEARVGSLVEVELPP